MLNIVLFEPEIPPNTGNIMRLCANTGTHLHLIEPLGFDLDEKSLRRAGLDYRDTVHLKIYKSFEEYREIAQPQRIFACSTKGRKSYHTLNFQIGDHLLFGPETRGLPAHLLTEFQDSLIRIPMVAKSRSINLSNAVAIILFEAWRQLEFDFNLE